MDRAAFQHRFLKAAAVAHDFGQQFLEESLPAEMRFRVHLNSSSDSDATTDFRRFPGDSSTAVSLANKNVCADDVVEVLFRQGQVPQWIDLAVAGETGDATILDVIACGRYTTRRTLESLLPPYRSSSCASRGSKFAVAWGEPELW